MNLRPYQAKAVKATERELSGGVQRTVVVLPCAAGKSHCIVALTLLTGNTLILAPTLELVNQNASKFNHYVEKWYTGTKGPHSNVVISTYASLKTRLRERVFDRVICDEAQCVSVTGVAGSIINKMDCQIIGLTATPYRSDVGAIYGPNDNTIFETKANEVSRLSLVNQGYLVRRNFVDMKTTMTSEGVPLVNGDYNTTALVNKVGDASLIVATKFATLEKTLVFCIDHTHAYKIAEVLPHAKIILSDTPKGERSQSITDFKAGKVKQLITVAVLTRGFDYPDLRNLLILRNTRSRELISQMYGRVDRPEVGKTKGNIFDCTDNFYYHVIRPMDKKSKSPIRPCKCCGVITDHRKDKCISCKVELGDGYISEAPIKVCPKCDHPNPVQVSYCQGCGEFLKVVHQDANNFITIRNFRIIQADKSGWKILLNKNSNLILEFTHEDVTSGALKEIFKHLDTKTVTLIKTSKTQPTITYAHPYLKAYVTRNIETNHLTLEGIKYIK